MDNKLKQDLDRYLTTPPEDEEFDAYVFTEYLSEVFTEFENEKITKEELFDKIVSKLKELYFY